MQQNIAIPLQIVATKQLTNYLRPINENLGCFGLIIGLPLTLSGNLGASSVNICNIIRDISAFINERNLPLWLHDERFTTAYSYSSVEITKKLNFVDDLCAMRILQEFLDLSKFGVSYDQDQPNGLPK